MSVQPPREVPVRTTKDCQQWKYTNAGVPSRGPGWVERTTLRREQLDDSDARPILQNVEAGQGPR
jgi:hypothetical protein